MTKKLLAAALVAAIVPTAAAQAKPRALKGTVVHRNLHAKSFVVTNARGRIAEVRLRKGNARFGRRVALRARVAPTGSYRAGSLRYHGRSDTALVRGAVTFVDEATRTFTVSDHGASLLVHLADETKPLPAVGDVVLVLADLTTSTPTTLEATDVTINPAAAATRPIEIEGVVLAIDEATRTITLSADDSEESGQMIAVIIPAQFDLSRFTVGDSVELRATLNDDGQTFTAVEIDDHNCSDNNEKDDDQGEGGTGDSGGHHHGDGGDSQGDPGDDR